VHDRDWAKEKERYAAEKEAAAAAAAAAPELRSVCAHPPHSELSSQRCPEHSKLTGV